MKIFNLLVVLILFFSACHAQVGKNDKKNNQPTTKNQISMEKFDIEKFNQHKSEEGYYTFDRDDGAVITQSQWGNQYFEEVRLKTTPFYIKKSFSSKGDLVQYTVQFHGNGFIKGVEYFYDEKGQLNKEIDHDAPFASYPWEQIERFLVEKRVNLLDNFTQVWRELDNANIPVWYLSWDTQKNDDSGNKVIQNIEINAQTGSVIKSDTTLFGEKKPNQ